MPLIVKDRVRENSVTSGTGTITLTGAVSSFQTFSSAIGNGNTTYYGITEQNTSNFEVGIGTVGAGTLTRDTVLESSNSGSLVNFGSAAKDVFCTYPAEKSVDIETPQTLTNKTISGASNTITNLPLTTGVTGVLPEANGGTGTTVGYNGFKNRIINGSMQIDQRNAGAGVTVNAEAYIFTLDRWSAFGQATDGVYTIQRSTTAPVGFVNSLLATVTTADASIGASQFYILRHGIEGLNVADLNWGTANASTVTLSFWVRSSLTGTFSGSLANASYNRAYPFTYTINSANTWEQKSITIAGDTTGTWATDNTAGINLYFDLGSGSSNKGTAGAWTGTGLIGVTGSVNLIGTSGATLNITGVQLEKGSTATSFDYRPYGTELALCQRYLPAYNATTSGVQFVATGGGFLSSSVAGFTVVFQVTPRTNVTGITVSSPSHFNFSDNVTGAECTVVNFSYTGLNCCYINATAGGAFSATYRAASLYSVNSSAQILFNGCEL
jgi:hypothetical protein